jgi:glycosyltransferase involved in cell wall biosynthesis
MSNLPSSATVTVVMGVYNVAAFVADALRSAQAQSLSEIEIIVADDGSTDGTADVAEQSADPRVRVLRLHHGGAAAALNRAIAEANGRYLALLDGDDLWDRDKLLRQVAFMQARPEVDLTFCLARTIDEHGRDLGLSSRGWPGPLPFERLLADNLIANCSMVVMRTEALRAAGPLDESLAGAYDYDLYLRIARQRPNNIYCVPEVLSSYRRRTGQITRDWRLMERCIRTVLKRHGVGAGILAPALEREALCNLYRYLAVLNYEAGQVGQGLALMARSLAAAPLVFARAKRSYLVTGALCTRAVLPTPIFRFVERTVRGC